jgi:hypothetical protein
MENFLENVVSTNVAESPQSGSVGQQSPSPGDQSAFESPQSPQSGSVGQQSPSPGDQYASDSQQGSEEGYGTQSNASYLDEGAYAMYDYPLRQLPEAHLKEYENTLKDMVRHPIEVDQEHDNPRSAAHRQITHDR